jgi:hypothetical protein
MTRRGKLSQCVWQSRGSSFLRNPCCSAGFLLTLLNFCLLLLSFHASNILWSDNPTDANEDALWVLPFKTPGSFDLDLRSVQLLSGVRLRNTHNADYGDYGTRDFSISMSNDTSGPWLPVVNASLADVLGVSVIPFQTFTIDPVAARFVRFEARSWYHNGGCALDGGAVHWALH